MNCLLFLADVFICSIRLTLGTTAQCHRPSISRYRQYGESFESNIPLKSISVLSVTAWLTLGTTAHCHRPSISRYRQYGESFESNIPLKSISVLSVTAWRQTVGRKGQAVGTLYSAPSFSDRQSRLLPTSSF